MDRLQAMSVFVGVAEEAGFAPAARRLFMSPPTVTRAVSYLEARLGARLFHRTTRSVHLTEAGQRYLADCQRILSEIQEADRHAAGIHAAPSGQVSVTASVMFGRMAMVPALIGLLDHYPDISVSTLFVDRVVHLIEEGIDVAIRIGDMPDSTLTAVRAGSVKRVLCASPAYFADRGRPKKPTDLARHDLISFINLTAGGEWDFERKGKVRTVKVWSRLHFNTADAAIAAALADRGITRLLSYMIAPYVRSGALEVVLEKDEPPPMPVHVVHKEAGQTSARIRAVVDFLVDHLRAYPALN